MTPSDEIVLMNTACVWDDGRLGILLSFYRHQPGGKSTFRGTLLRWDTEDGWKEGLKGLENLEPARQFTLSTIGIDNQFSELPVRNHGKYLLCLNALNEMRRLLARKISLESFLEKNRGLTGNFEFVTEFDGKRFEDMADRSWHLFQRAKTERKKTRIIY
jgi:hypothetical protein